VPSFDVVMPMENHRICVRHLYANFRDKEFRGVTLKELLWKAASSYTEVDFRFQMEEIKKVRPDAFDYLDKIDSNGWSRAWFSDYPKCDLLVKNGSARTSTDGEGRVFRLTPRTPQVAAHGAATTSSTPAKGKRIAHTIETGLQIMESKPKRKRPEWKH
jgi:hypothetical protein